MRRTKAMKDRQKKVSGSGGCGFLLGTCVFACAMLVFNGLLISQSYPFLETAGPPLVREARFSQAVMFIGPVLLLLAEWWLWDRLVEWLVDSRRSRRDSQQS